MKTELARGLRRIADRLSPEPDHLFPPPAPVQLHLCGELDGRAIEAALLKHQRRTGRVRVSL